MTPAEPPRIAEAARTADPTMAAALIPAVSGGVTGRDGEPAVASEAAAEALPFDVAVSAALVPSPQRTRLRQALAALAIVLPLAVGATAVWASRAGLTAFDPEPASGGRSRVMVAMLPFENLTGDPDQEYFSDGLTEEMITELGRLDPSRLGVIARTSSMAYKGTKRSAHAIADELGVEYVLEGSVRREADRVRIVAQLIRASDQTHVWAKRYDRDLRSILALQTEIARAIVDETRRQLSASDDVRLGRSVHPDAYQAYLRGRFFLNQRRGQAIQKGREEFEEANAIDPGYAQAYAGLADAHELSASYAGATPRESNARAMAAARRALDLDSTLAEPYTSLGVLCGSYTWEWRECIALFERAIELNASLPMAHKGYSEVLSFLGRHDEAIAEAKRSVALDPLSLIMHSNLGVTYYRARRFDEAIRQMQQTLEMDPHYILGHFNLGMIFAAAGSYDDAVRALQRARGYAPDDASSLAFLGYVYGRMGRTAYAREVERELRRRSATQYVSPYLRATIHVALGEQRQALKELERSHEDRTWLIATLKVDPTFDPLRGDERFEALIRRLNFPDGP